MIKYKLFCKDCDLKFDSWFASSNEYDRLKENFLTELSTYSRIIPISCACIDSG